jgi:hypothetical protein
MSVRRHPHSVARGGGHKSANKTDFGNARANFVWSGLAGAPDRDAFYSDALADSIQGSDHRPGEPDIIANFNSDCNNWYFGTDGNTPFGEFDLVSVVLHEIGHGLGFSGTELVTYDLNVAAGLNKQDNTPFKKRAGRTNIREAFARVTITSGSGVQIYASLIDQITGDATTIPPKE